MKNGSYIANVAGAKFNESLCRDIKALNESHIRFVRILRQSICPGLIEAFNFRRYDPCFCHVGSF
jgi:hypothetical protein